MRPIPAILTAGLSCAAIAMTFESRAGPEDRAGAAQPSVAGPSVSLMVGRGLESKPNFWGVGAGARAGHTFDVPVYVGATFVRHFGTEDEGPGYRDAYSLDLFAVESGYEMRAAPIAVRPYLTLGGARLAVDHEQTGGVAAEDERFTSLHAGGGVTTFLEIDRAFVGLDVRVAYIADDYVTGDASFNASNLASYGFAGARF